MREVPVSSAFPAFSPVVARPLVFGNGLRYFAIVFNGWCWLVKPRRDMTATWKRQRQRLADEETSENLPRDMPLDLERLPKEWADVGRRWIARQAAAEAAPPPRAFINHGQRPQPKRQRKPKPVKRWRKPLPQKDIKSALSGILEAEPTLSSEKLEAALRARLGELMTREQARKAIKRYAPQTVRPRGRPRKNNSPK
jgi:hypothetical protein